MQGSMLAGTSNVATTYHVRGWHVDLHQKMMPNLDVRQTMVVIRTNVAGPATLRHMGALAQPKIINNTLNFELCT